MGNRRGRKPFSDVIGVLIRKLLCAAIQEVQDICECQVCDVFGDMPTEIVATIFRYLDEDSLVAAAGVNRRWRAICQEDFVLRRKIYYCLQGKLLRKAKRYLRWQESLKEDEDYLSPRDEEIVA